MEIKPPRAQKSIFGNNPAPDKPWLTSIFRMFVDGASRGNPGPAGIGIFCHKLEAGDDNVSVDQSKPVVKKGFFLGHCTNNIAEYMALLSGLFLLIKYLKLEPDGSKLKPALQIFSDSQLMVNQLKGTYKTRDIEIQIVKRVIDKLLFNFNWEITHVLRDKNVQADRLANNGIDSKNAFDPDLKAFLVDNDLLQLFT